jgi:hypothetical protein
MALCLGKKESIKSTTMWLYSFGKALRHKQFITDQEYQLYLSRLKRIENCTNLEETYLTLTEGGKS